MTVRSLRSKFLFFWSSILVNQLMVFHILNNRIPSKKNIKFSHFSLLFAFSYRNTILGTFAVISIMSSNAAEKLNALPVQPITDLSGFPRNSTQFFATNATSNPTVDYNTLEVLTALSMLTGIFQVSNRYYITSDV